MVASLVRLDQLHVPGAYNDEVSAANILLTEANALDYEDVLHSVLSQLKRIIDGDTAGDWKQNPTDVGGKDGSLRTLAARATLEGKLGLFWRLNLNDVTVPNGQNYVALTGSTKPDKNIAVATTAKGAATAQLAGAIGAHDLAEIAGSNTLKPANLVAVFNGATGDAMLDTNGRRIWGLLQVGSAATDGNPFGDSGNDQGQISFVTANATYDDLIACPVADIEDEVIVFAYSERNDLSSVPQDYFRGDLAAADPAAGVVQSLDNAYNGGSTVDVDNTDVDWRLADTLEWIVRISGGNPLLRVVRNDSTGDIVEVGAAADEFDVNAVVSDFANGAKFDTGTQTINVGITQGQIDSTALELEATTGAASLKASGTLQNVNLSATEDVTFQTKQETTPIPLDDDTVGEISGLFGGSWASIAAAINAAGDKGGVDLYLNVYTVSGGPYAKDVNIPGASLDLTAFSIDMNTPANVNAFVFLNGRLLVGGNASTNNDIYAGDTPANGDLKHDFDGAVINGDWIITIGLKA